MPADTDALIAALESPNLRELAARGRVQSYRKDVVIIQEGDYGDTLHIILSGRVKVFAFVVNGKESTTTLKQSVDLLAATVNGCY